MKPSCCPNLVQWRVQGPGRPDPPRGGLATPPAGSKYQQGPSKRPQGVVWRKGRGRSGSRRRLSPLITARSRGCWAAGLLHACVGTCGNANARHTAAGARPPPRLRGSLALCQRLPGPPCCRPRCLNTACPSLPPPLPAVLTVPRPARGVPTAAKPVDSSTAPPRRIATLGRCCAGVASRAQAGGSSSPAEASSTSRLNLAAVNY